jgi:hypothetical protein
MAIEKEIEKHYESCPKCNSAFIQYDHARNEIYCLMRNCNHRWKMNFESNRINNFFLKTSLNGYKKFIVTT